MLDGTVRGREIRRVGWSGLPALLPRPNGEVGDSALLIHDSLPLDELLSPMRLTVCTITSRQAKGETGGK
jgi:hypothetical protein